MVILRLIVGQSECLIHGRFQEMLVPSGTQNSKAQHAIAIWW